MGKRLKIYCLPGFLGSARDWDGLEAALRTLPDSERWELRKLDYFSPESRDPGPELSMGEWARGFCAGVRAEREADGLAGDSSARPILIGYSLGGRLGLEALAADPELWGGAILVSAQPGLANPIERRERTESDEEWAQRFETEHWRFLLGAWNNLPVFGGARQELERPETAYSRARLAAALRNWSVGRQDNHWPTLTRLREAGLPIFWMAGERDAKFAAITRRVASALPEARTWICPQAGHRLPWERSDEFHARVIEFLRDGLGSVRVA